MTSALAAFPAAGAFELRRIRVDEYHRMIDAGILGEDDRVELLEGLIVNMSPPKPAHAVVIQRLTDAQFTRLPRAYLVRCQLPLTLADSEPEPDVAVVPREGCQTAEHPSSAPLVFEVARRSAKNTPVIQRPSDRDGGRRISAGTETLRRDGQTAAALRDDRVVPAQLTAVQPRSATLRHDREVKGRIYAKAGIAEYVLVDLRRKQLEVWRDPDAPAGRYRTRTVVGVSGTFASASVPGLRFAVRDLLGDLG